MGDFSLLLVLTGTAAAGLALASAASLKAWNQWLELRQQQLQVGKRRSAPAGELRTLRDRVRRLEAIADGTQN